MIHLVTRLPLPSLRGVRRSRQLLLDVGAKIFGVVLKNVSVRSHDYYYYYQRYYHQSYYSQDADKEEASPAAGS